MAQTPRSSSLVENINSRLRNYFTLRRHLGGSYLGLLRFFLNHRRFMRSRRAERNGKSPRELMTGQGHPHWLTLLGLGPLQPRPRLTREVGRLPTEPPSNRNPALTGRRFPRGICNPKHHRLSALCPTSQREASKVIATNSFPRR